MKTISAILSLACLSLSASADDDAVLKDLRERGAKTSLYDKTTHTPVVDLYLNKKTFGDADLARLGQFKSLRTLNLQGSSVTDDGLKVLANLPALESLDLYLTGVSPAGLKHVASIKTLHTLGYNVDQITDESLKELLRLDIAYKLSGFSGDGPGRPKSNDDVTWIQLSSSKLTEAGYKQLGAFKKVKVIDIHPAYMTDGVLHVLRELNLLHTLELARVRNKNHADSAAEVDSVTISCPHVTAVGLKEFAAFPNLLTLDVQRSNLDDAAMKVITSFKTLQSLGLSKNFTDASLAELAKLESLNALGFNEGSEVTDAGLKSIAKIKSLRRLSLHYTKATPEGLKELKGMKLEVLTLDKSQVTDTTLRILRENDQLYTLRQAYSRGRRPTSMEDVHFLRLGGTKVTDAGLKELVGMTSLEVLELGNTGVTDAGVAELQKAIPGARISR
jgi:internalin A